ncbi:MAG: helix-turn-helix domain-containing protein [Acidobacteriaceae bacterium]
MALLALGTRLRSHRIDRGDTQSVFARRIGVSVPTYRKMERGSPAVPIGYWVRTWRLLECMEPLNLLLPVSLFSEGAQRQRVPAKTRRPHENG